MVQFLIATWTFVILFITLVVLRLLGLRISVPIAIGSTLLFAIYFIATVAMGDTNLWSFIYMLVCALFISSGAKQLPMKTQTAVIDNTTGEPVSGLVLKSGKIHLLDPLFDTATASTDGEPDVAIDMQEL